MTDRLNKLYEKVYNDEATKDPKYFVKIVDKDKDIFSKCDIKNNEDEFKFLRLLSDYGICLTSAGFFIEALNYTTKAILKFEESNFIKGKNIFKEPLYQDLIFNHGISLIKLKKTYRARLDFKILNTKFPQEEKYLNWFKQSSVELLTKLEWIFAGFAMICLLTSYLIKPEHGIMNRIMPFTTFIGIIGVSIARFKRKRFSNKV